MGKQNKLREVQRRAAEQAIAVRLRAHTPARTEPAFVNSFAEFAPVYRDRIEPYRDLAVRAPEAWRCTLRVRSPAQRFLDLVRFSFAKYPIPLHLENAWTDAAPDEWPIEASVGIARPDFRRWSISVGRGDSLCRDGARQFMSKLETHHFVTAPAEVGSTQRAFWYAFARAQTDDTALALRISRAKLVRYPVTDPLWRDAVRFFVQNPLATHEINDLIDYIGAAYLGTAGCTLKGRSLAALRRRMVAWHSVCRAEVSGVRWLGHPRPDARYETWIGGRRVIWRIRQIKSSGGLVREGQAMQHCVAAYQEQCQRGAISIWSLTRESPIGRIKRCLTIQLEAGGSFGQCGGFANRPPTAEDYDVLQRWAEDQDLWGLRGI
jgi:hypothetical protein